MIEVADVLQAVPHFNTFCSVEKLHRLVETIGKGSTKCDVKVAGTSVSGTPIHHVRFGKGSVKALFVAFPHPNEPVGGLTVFSLMTLLNEGHRELLDADVEWHIVPCIDPDGAMLNEGWSQKAFTFDSYMKNFHRQEPRDQVECSFPIKYKRLIFDEPTREAKILQRLLAEIRPDLYFSLHNLAAGGATFFCLTRNIDQKYHRELHQLVEQHHLQLDRNMTFMGPWGSHFGEGIYGQWSTRKQYDCLEQTMSCPEETMRHGACSWEYLAEIKGGAIALVAEVPHVKHPSDGSKRQTAQNLRQLRLRMDADSKFVATVILEEWDKVGGELDSSSAFYKKIFNGVISVKETLRDGLPSWPFKTQDVLFNPAYSRTATEGERFAIHQERFFLLCQNYEFVRLLKTSTQTPGVKEAIERLDSIFDDALGDIARNIGLEKSEVVDCDTLAKVQLGSGLIVLNSILETQSIP